MDKIRGYTHSTKNVSFCFQILFIPKVNSGRSIEVTSANPKVEVTLANFTPLAYFMLQQGSKNFLLFQIFILYKWKFVRGI